MRKLDYDKEPVNGERIFRSLPKNYSGIYVIPDGITAIAENAFEDCGYLTSVEIPKSVTSIRDWAFSGCSGLTTLEIPSDVTSIGYSAFADCSGLTAIKIPSGVISIEDNAFFGCSDLNTLEIHDTNSLVHIGKCIVGNCPKLDPKVRNRIDSLNRHIEETESDYILFAGPDEITEKTNETENWDSDVSLKTGIEIVIPDGTEKIRDYEFASCSDIISIMIPSGVTSIGDGAFYGCSGLTTLEIPSGVTSIGDWAFYGCSGLTTLEIPSGVTSIGNSAFADCSGLTTIVIPSGVTSIGNWAFYRCSGLTSIVIPSSVNTISRNAFSECINLSKVKLLGSYVSISWPIFSGCTELKKVSFEQQKNSKYIIENGIFYNRAKTELLECVSSMCDGNVTIDRKVRTIRSGAFSDMKSMKTIELPEYLRTIKESAFDFESSKVKIIVNSVNPDSIDIHYDDSSPSKEDSLQNISKDCTLVVPECSGYAYRHHPVWGQFTVQVASDDADELTSEENPQS